MGRQLKPVRVPRPGDERLVASGPLHLTGRGRISLLVILSAGVILFTRGAGALEVNVEGWPVPNLKGITPYLMTVARVDGVEKVVEKFYTPDGGHVARISGNGKVFAYVIDHDQEPPIDYLLLDTEGYGKFTEKLSPIDIYSIPRWVSE